MPPLRRGAASHFITPGKHKQNVVPGVPSGLASVVRDRPSWKGVKIRISKSLPRTASRSICICYDCHRQTMVLQPALRGSRTGALTLLLPPLETQVRFLAPHRVPHKENKTQKCFGLRHFCIQEGPFREGRFERGSEGGGLCPASFGYDSNDEDRTMRGYVASLACMHVAMPMFAEDRGEDIHRKPLSCFCSSSAASDEMPFFAGWWGRRLGCWCPEAKCRRTDPEDGQLRQAHR